MFNKIKDELSRARNYRARDKEYAKECGGSDLSGVQWKERTSPGKVLFITGLLFLPLGFVLIWRYPSLLVGGFVRISTSGACLAAAWLCLTVSDFPVYKRQKRYGGIVCDVLMSICFILMMFTNAA